MCVCVRERERKRARGKVILDALVPQKKWKGAVQCWPCTEAREVGKQGRRVGLLHKAPELGNSIASRSVVPDNWKGPLKGSTRLT